MHIPIDLLDALDDAVNSNSFWLSFEIPNETAFDVNEFLIHQLRTGIFHFEMVKQDVERGWNIYGEWIFPKDWKTPAFIQRPGNTWNGKSLLEIEEISKNTAEELLMDLLTGEQKYFSRTGLGSPFTQANAQPIVQKFLNSIHLHDKSWIAYNIKPDFLNAVNDTLNTDNTLLPYFENAGRDLALGFNVDGRFYLLLTNGYS